MLIRSGSALGSAKGVRSQRRVPYRPGLDRRRFLLTSPLGVGRADAPRLRPRRAGVPPLWRAATVDRDGRGPEAIRAILGALGGWREREGRARPGRRPVPRGCTAPERRADAAVAEVCSVASWAGGTPLDRRPAPAENPVTRWLSALRRGGSGGGGAGNGGSVNRALCPSYAQSGYRGDSTRMNPDKKARTPRQGQKR